MPPLALACKIEPAGLRRGHRRGRRGLGVALRKGPPVPPLTAAEVLHPLGGNRLGTQCLHREMGSRSRGPWQHDGDGTSGVARRGRRPLSELLSASLSWRFGEGEEPGDRRLGIRPVGLGPPARERERCRGGHARGASLRPHDRQTFERIPLGRRHDRHGVSVAFGGHRGPRQLQDPAYHAPDLALASGGRRPDLPHMPERATDRPG